MNAQSITRRATSPFVTIALATGLLASAAFGAVSLHTGATLPSFGSQPAASVLPSVHIAEHAGEGRLGSTQARSVTTVQAHSAAYAGEGREQVAALRAAKSLPTLSYTQQAFMGEGRANDNAQRAAASLPTLSYAQQAFMGEGRANVAAQRDALTLPRITWAAAPGMGEGWLSGYAAQDAAHVAISTSCGQGQGLLQQRTATEDTCK